METAWVGRGGPPWQATSTTAAMTADALVMGTVDDAAAAPVAAKKVRPSCALFLGETMAFLTCLLEGYVTIRAHRVVGTAKPVSYTHLTLPTIYSV